jgi:hypothetical protein
MQSSRAHEGQAVNVAEVDFTTTEEEGAKENHEQKRASQVGVIHYIFQPLDTGKWVEDCKGLRLYVPKVDVQLF